MKLNDYDYDALYESGNWMIRMDNDGESYNGFCWNPIGEWTEPKEWSDEPTCDSGGLFGQSLKAAGFCGSGSRLVLCETEGDQIVVHGNRKVRVRRAKIVATDMDVEARFLEGMALGLASYDHPLPKGLMKTGYLDLTGYAHPLPDGLVQTGNLCLDNYDHPLPASLQQTGELCLDGYNHPLPAGLVQTGNLWLTGYDHPLPNGLKRKV